MSEASTLIIVRLVTFGSILHALERQFLIATSVLFEILSTRLFLNNGILHVVIKRYSEKGTPIQPDIFRYRNTP
jgi:hypothetical protein